MTDTNKSKPTIDKLSFVKMINAQSRKVGYEVHKLQSLLEKYDVVDDTSEEM